MKKQSFAELLKDAIQLLNDQTKEIADLMYWVATLDDEARSALVMAYRLNEMEDE